MTNAWVVIYPFIATIVCIKKPLKSELLHWCIWWVTYMCCNLVNTIMWWVPFIETVETVFLFSVYSQIMSEYIRKLGISYFKTYFKKIPQMSQMYIETEKLIRKLLISLITQTSK